MQLLSSDSLNSFRIYLKIKGIISEESMIIIYNFKDAVIKGSSVTVSEKVKSV
ncbi:MAG: hypothetical protein AABX83_04165 [Nanoarchaeota archaeon]